MPVLFTTRAAAHHLQRRRSDLWRHAHAWPHVLLPEDVRQSLPWPRHSLDALELPSGCKVPAGALQKRQQSDTPTFLVELNTYGASLTCQVPRTYHAGSGVVHADKAGEAFTRQPLDAHGGRRQVARLRDPRGRVRVKVGR